MKYVATADFTTAITDDEILDVLAPNNAALAESAEGYRVICTIEAASLDKAIKQAKDTIAPVGDVFALSVVPENHFYSDLANGDLPPLVSVAQAAELLGITPQGVNKRLKNGALPGTKVGNTWVIPLHAVLNEI